jgi:transcriptional regulator with GAF, ATPase, and Fis domain
MINVSREEKMLETFAGLADTLVASYDVVDLLQTLVEACGDLEDVSAAAILFITSTSEASRLVEVMQLSAQAGPCIDCVRSGTVISLPDIAQAPEEWNAFRQEALNQGFRSVYAIPLRLRDSIIGALNLMRTSIGELDRHDVRASRALADVATIGILQARALSDAMVLRDQLTNALNSRVLIEQAKGVISHLLGISTEEAFVKIRQHARSNQQHLSYVAAEIVARRLRL